MQFDRGRFAREIHAHVAHMLRDAQTV
jgi:signal transduction histidine kinase